MLAEPPAFSTDHLYLAAFLVCRGHQVLRHLNQGARVAFVFDDTEQLSHDVSGFMSGAVIPARQFSFEILKLKKTLPRAGQTMEKVNTNESQIRHR